MEKDDIKLPEHDCLYESTNEQGYIDLEPAYRKSTVLRLLEADRQSRMPSDEVAELVALLCEIRPCYGDVGSRDVDVAAQQQRIDRAIDLLSRYSSGQPAASAKPDDMPPLDDRATYPASMIRRLIREDRARRAAHVAQEPVAWVSKTIAYSKYISDARYRKLRPAVQRWYEPYKCASCAAHVAAQAQPVVNQQMTTDAALADTQRQIIEARALAGELEKLVLEVANSERKPQKLPLEPIVRAYQVLRKLAGVQQ